MFDSRSYFRNDSQLWYRHNRDIWSFKHTAHRTQIRVIDRSSTRTKNRKSLKTLTTPKPPSGGRGKDWGPTCRRLMTLFSWYRLQIWSDSPKQWKKGGRRRMLIGNYGRKLSSMMTMVMISPLLYCNPFVRGYYWTRNEKNMVKLITTMSTRTGHEAEVYGKFKWENMNWNIL